MDGGRKRSLVGMGSLIERTGQKKVGVTYRRASRVGRILQAWRPFPHTVHARSRAFCFPTTLVVVKSASQPASPPPSAIALALPCTQFAFHLVAPSTASQPAILIPAPWELHCIAHRRFSLGCAGYAPTPHCLHPPPLVLSALHLDTPSSRTSSIADTLPHHHRHGY